MEKAQKVEFIEHYPLSELIPADYNPRLLSDEKFALLQKSLRKFGIVKPVIVNGSNGILTAGHQRTRAMKSLGMTHCPALRLTKISRADEIWFNLYHNSIETNKNKVTVSLTGSEQPRSFFWLSPNDISFEANKNPQIVHAIASLMLRYGPWGSVLVSPDGSIIENADYAVACKQMQLPLLCYLVPDSDRDELLSYLSVEYGSYYYEALDVKTWHQHMAQPHRLSGAKQANQQSKLYRNFVLPELEKTDRLLDFGAGEGKYPEKLRKDGFQAFAYEPHIHVKGSLNVRKTVRQIFSIEQEIAKNGLYDKIVLEAVLNSVTSKTYEDFVLTCVTSLLKSDGKLYLTTRNVYAIHYYNTIKRVTRKKKTIEFLDPDGFAATYRNGAFTLQHFHTADSLEALLRKYFNEITFLKSRITEYLTILCTSPKILPTQKVKRALEEEFNMPYPGGYRHNMHQKLVQTVLQTLKHEKRL